LKKRHRGQGCKLEVPVAPAQPLLAIDRFLRGKALAEKRKLQIRGRVWYKVSRSERV